MSVLRSKAITCLLAVIAQIATPGLVFCQEIDGSVQIEFASEGCCNTDPVDAGATRVEDTCATTGVAPGTCVEASPAKAPDCACEQDTSLSPLVTRPRVGLIDHADLHPALPGEAHPGLHPQGGPELPPLQPRSPPRIRGGVLAALRTIVLRH